VGKQFLVTAVSVGISGETELADPVEEFPQADKVNTDNIDKATMIFSFLIRTGFCFQLGMLLNLLSLPSTIMPISHGVTKILKNVDVG
jgi:hypothetical protein